jgi:hypothetical protein
MSMSENITAFELSADGDWRQSTGRRALAGGGSASVAGGGEHLQTALMRRIVDRSE